ncbi:MAG: tetratricopeptide repeat protein [Caulobacteraceae bacterium]
MKHLLLAGAFVALTTGVAQAAVLVIGSANAQSCYEAALAERGSSEALELCTFALREEPLTRRNRAATLVNRGIVYSNREDHANALEDFDAAIELDPRLAEGYTNRAAALLDSGDYRGALDAASRGLALTPHDPAKAHYISGVAHEELGDIRAAYADYRRAAELAPEWTAPQTELARFRVASR